VTKFRLYNNLLCYQPKGAKTRRKVAPALLRTMLLKYFHDSPVARHLGAYKTWKKVWRKYYRPNVREDVFQYVRQCELCRRAKLTRNAKAGLLAECRGSAK
jgi:hypothetical protein